MEQVRVLPWGLTERTNQMSEYQPDYAVPPGRTIKELMGVHGFPDAQGFADLMIWDLSAVDDLISGKIEIDESTAKFLEQAFGLPANNWLRMEANYIATLKRLGQERPT